MSLEKFSQRNRNLEIKGKPAYCVYNEVRPRKVEGLQMLSLSEEGCADAGSMR